MKKHLCCLLALISGLFNPTLLLANDPSPETTRLLASQCTQCHGTTGNSKGDFDSIAGVNFQELLSDLLDMKNSDDNEVMHKQIKVNTEQQLWFIADYFSSLPKISTGPNILPDSEVKDNELSEAEKKILEAEKKALEEAREADKNEEEGDD